MRLQAPVLTRLSNGLPSTFAKGCLVVLLGLPVFGSISQDSGLSFEALSQQATLAMEENRIDDAFRHYAEALELNPLWEEGWWYQGMLLYENRRFTEAARSFRSVTSLNSEMGPAWVMLGLSQFQNRDYYRAFESLGRGVQVGVGGNERLRFAAFYHRAVLLNRFEQFEPAFNLLFTLAKNQSENPAVIEALGLCALRIPLLPAELPEERRDLVRRAGQAVALSSVEKVEEAQKAFEDLLRAYPTTRNVHYAYGQFLGVRNNARAVELFEQELAVSPDHVPARLQLAWQHLNRGEPLAALEFARQAAKMEADSLSVRYVSGRILLDLGKLEEAIAELEAALRLMPENSQVRSVLAQAYFRAGRKEDAQAQLAEVNRLRSQQLEKEQGLIFSGADAQAPQGPGNPEE